MTPPKFKRGNAQVSSSSRRNCIPPKSSDCDPDSGPTNTISHSSSPSPSLEAMAVLQKFTVCEIEKRQTHSPRSCEESFTAVPNIYGKASRSHRNLSSFWVQPLVFSDYNPRYNSFQEYLTSEMHSVSESIHNDCKHYFETVAHSLEQLLLFRFNVFWSQISFDSSLRSFLDSFLQNFLRSYEFYANSSLSLDDPRLPEDIARPLKRFCRAILLVFYRLRTPMESNRNFLSPSKYEEIIKQYRLFDLSKLCDLMNLYGHSNPLLIKEICQATLQNIPSISFHLPFLRDILVNTLNSISASLLCISPKHDDFSSSSSSSDDTKSSKGRMLLLLAMDTTVTLLSLCEFLPEEARLKFWKISSSSQQTKSPRFSHPSPSSQQNLHHTEGCLSYSLMELYCILISSEWYSLYIQTTPISPLRLILLRCRRMITRCLIFCMAICWLPSSSSEDINSMFDAFTVWILAVVDHCSPNSNDLLTIKLFSEDLLQTGLKDIIFSWKQQTLIDDERLFFSLAALFPEKESLLTELLHMSEISESSLHPLQEEETLPVFPIENDFKEKLPLLIELTDGYSDGFLWLCLKYYNGNVETVINSLLESTVSEALLSFDTSISLEEARTIYFALHASQPPVERQPPLSLPLLCEEEIPEGKSSMLPLRRAMPPQVLTVDERKKILKLWEVNTSLENQYDDEFDDSQQYVGSNFLQARYGDGNSDLDELESQSTTSSKENLQIRSREGAQENSSLLHTSKAAAPVITGQTYRGQKKNETRRHQQKNRRSQKMQRGML
ncbi:hypothetical protein IE077_003222 [Cardiosporidium cionae]|uniref:CUE domain-containing protein n=1 Tax=Cardiosporidium cionae TaxID=476202 RepID=A0ABQ7J8R4_9APIC|nr:hypothetical protein IE077_003222 [Cardiosporidium cionae]|eukprot:KAF8820385.1 hypothetical protein IE077_003222 [Cardiosporidium cionae]